MSVGYSILLLLISIKDWHAKFEDRRYMNRTLNRGSFYMRVRKYRVVGIVHKSESTTLFKFWSILLSIKLKKETTANIPMVIAIAARKLVPINSKANDYNPMFRQLINQRQYLCLEQLSSNKTRNIFCYGWYFAVKYINRRHSNAIAASSHRLNIGRLFNQQQWLITNYRLLSNTQGACLKQKFCKSE